MFAPFYCYCRPVMLSRLSAANRAPHPAGVNINHGRCATIEPMVEAITRDPEIMPAFPYLGEHEYLFRRCSTTWKVAKR
jgi:hypothetical protein